MQKILFCFCLISLYTAAYSQPETLLEDDFKKNKNAWKLQKDANFLVDINNGVLHLEKFEKNFTSRGCLWYNKTIPGLNTLKDFSITMYARFVSGGDIFDMIDLQWGARDKTDVTGGRKKDSLYQLSFLLKGEVKLDYFNYKWSYYVRKNIKTILDSDEFKAGSFNKYELMQKDGFVIFSVNDKELLKQLYDPIPGNSIGFQQCLKSAWEIDKIIIRQLNPGKPKATVADTSRTIPLGENNAVAENGLKVYPNPFENTLHINFDLAKEETVQLFLIDIYGTILQQHTRKLQKGLQDISIYADVAPGTYIIKVQTSNEKALTATVIKQ
jgi:Secretion system C-terminal sorting domain